MERIVKTCSSLPLYLKSSNPQMAGTERGSKQNGSHQLSPVLFEPMSQVKFLTYLHMSGIKLICLPKEICELVCLEELYVSGCSLKALPETFGNLIKLKSLDVSNNFFSEFPLSFQQLKSLVNLKIARNEQLLVFPVLPENLIALDLRGCSKLQAISLKKDMKFLKTMDLSHCESLTAISTLIGCKSLKIFKLDGCKHLDRLDPLPESLTSLQIAGCSKLQKIFINIKFDERRKCKRIVYDCPIPAARISYRRPAVHPPQMKELCLIGCHNIRLHINQLLEDFRQLERLDLSLSSELVNESKPLAGQKNLTVKSKFFCVAAFFFFVAERGQNALLSQMNVLMTFLDDSDGSLLSKTFQVPSRMKGDESGRFMVRVCIWDRKYFIHRGRVSCSYSVQDRLSQHRNQVSLRHMEFLALKEVATSENVIHFFEQWGLLSASKDIKVHEFNAIKCQWLLGVVVKLNGSQRAHQGSSLVECKASAT